MTGPSWKPLCASSAEIDSEIHHAWSSILSFVISAVIEPP